jgi:hypothetical protein
MPDPNIARFPAAAAPDVGATVDALLTFLSNVETAEGSLGLDRGKKVSDKIDAFVTTSKTAVVPADALKARLDIEALRKSYDDQGQALEFWEKEAGIRLDGLAKDYSDQVLDALDKRLTQLRQQKDVEQGDVAKVNSVIAQFEDRRRQLEARIRKGRSKKGAAARA